VNTFGNSLFIMLLYSIGWAFTFHLGLLYNIRKVTDQQRVIALFVLVFKRRSHSTHLNQLTVEFRDFEFRDFSCYLRLSREQVAKAPKAKVPKIVVGSGTGSLGCISRANFASIAVPN
jgi:hypothetical protein